MKLEKLVGERFKEKPSDCIVDSHAFMIRGGFMKYVAGGIYSQYTPLKRICQKIEAIIREEMNLIDGQEVQFPVVMPASLWEESGRLATVGKELLRFEDRNNSHMILGMTHEEAAVHLVREYGQSYTKYPFMIYQIQTKFRDEARPRAGLIRVREFMMKDAYSFHISQKDLDEYYHLCYHAYERIFARVGIPNVIIVASDSGMMGGSISHEYMLLTPIGEDSLAICSNCNFKANVEAAESIVINEKVGCLEELKLENTSNLHTIEEICDYFNKPSYLSCKAVVYQKNMIDEYIIVFIRGDLEVSESKLANYLGEDVYPAVLTADCELSPGNIGPYNLIGNYIVIFDNSLKNTCNMICGANKNQYHYTGLQIERDCGKVNYIDLAKIKDGGICPECGKHSINISRGIEVGNIFQLGSKYTKSMNMQYIDKNGNNNYPIMGCYGIGIGRLAASVCECHHDECGPIWPITIAPWQVHLCCIRADDEETVAFADNLYRKLLNERIEVIYDDRNVRAGVMFSDADLLGVPIRVIVSPKNMKDSCVEITTRDKSVQMKVSAADIIKTIKELTAQLTDKIENTIK